MELGNTITLTKEQTEELYAVREATLPELVSLAEKCGEIAEIKHNSDGLGYVVLASDPDTMWEPRYIPSQNHLLLAALISKGDCKLFYDDGVEEFFIYQYTPGPEMDPPLTHHSSLEDTCFDAAMKLWFPKN